MALSFFEKIKMHSKAENNQTDSKPLEEKDNNEEKPACNLEELKKAIQNDEDKQEEKELTPAEKAEKVYAEVLAKAGLDDSKEEQESKPEEISKDTADEKTETASSDTEKKTDEDANEETAAKEEKPKKNAKRSRKKAKAADKQEDTENPSEKEVAKAVIENPFPVADFVPQDIFGTKMTFDEMAKVFGERYYDAEWEKLLRHFDELITSDKVRITNDINPGSMKFLIEELDAIYSEVLPLWSKYKGVLESLTDKDFGIATSYRTMMSVGANSEERKRNGFMALCDAKSGDKEINYIDFIAVLRMRFNELDRIIKTIDKKKEMTVTFASQMKLEGGLMAAQA